MRICQIHWARIKEEVTKRGMGHLIIRDAQEAFDHVLAEARGQAVKFDPAMTANNMMCGQALKVFGINIAAKRESNENDGHWCPLCVARDYTNHNTASPIVGKLDEEWITGCINAVRLYAIEQGFLNVN